MYVATENALELKPTVIESSIGSVLQKTKLKSITSKHDFKQE